MTTGHAGHSPPARRRLSGGGWPDAHDSLEAAAALVPISDTGRLRKVPEVARVPARQKAPPPPGDPGPALGCPRSRLLTGSGTFQAEGTSGVTWLDSRLRGRLYVRVLRPVTAAATAPCSFPPFPFSFENKCAHCGSKEGAVSGPHGPSRPPRDAAP